MPPASRRHLLQSAAAAALIPFSQLHNTGPQRTAQIAITLDLEMSRNFPTWESTHWDYEKGNLNEETKRYATAAAQRVKAAGGVIHFFAVGRVLEQPDVTWLAELANNGHPIGNHTYDHINILATRPDDLQFRFQRAPWLLRGMPVADAIRENIRIAAEALQSRIKTQPAGFRTPGGFSDGLRQHPAIRSMLKELGYSWVSSLYPPHPVTQPLQEPDDKVLQGILDAHKLAQPFAYEDGLIEIPMSPISDIGAFRTGRWKLEWFLKSLRQCIQWTIDNGAVFDFLAHPSCLYVVDPEFKAIDLICEMVGTAANKAQIVDLGTIAKQVQSK
ncbi:MAG: hypothetical protein RLZZ458_1071 [Planctomycetota bacterium]